MVVFSHEMCRVAACSNAAVLGSKYCLLHRAWHKRASLKALFAAVHRRRAGGGLENLTRRELRNFARDRGLVGYRWLGRGALIRHLRGDTSLRLWDWCAAIPLILFSGLWTVLLLPIWLPRFLWRKVLVRPKKRPMPGPSERHAEHRGGRIPDTVGQQIEPMRAFDGDREGQLREPRAPGRQVLGPCELLSRIGEGGMGVVYRARHLNLDIDVAVKVLRVGSAAEARQVARFQREAKAAARIDAQNVVRVLDVGEAHGVYYMIMEYVPGENARRFVQRVGLLTAAQAAFIGCEAARGLAEAHLRGIIHRDVKPDNILISRRGIVKVSDFGLAGFRGDLTPNTARGFVGDAHLTQAGAVLGTPMYMASEQWLGLPLSPATDIWALGATLYFLLTRSDPSIGGRPCGQVQDSLPDVRRQRSAVPGSLAGIIRRAMMFKPAGRYQCAADLAGDLERESRGRDAELPVARDET